MNTVKEKTVVEIDYTLMNSNGEVLDSSKNHGPLAFIYGKKNILAGLENQLTGKATNEELKIIVSPEDAYGLRDENLVQAVDKSQFGADADSIEPGMQFEMESNHNRTVVMTAIEVKDDEVILDGNHPLAGESLHFDVKILSIREATEDELTRGTLKPESSCCSSSKCCD